MTKRCEDCGSPMRELQTTCRCGWTEQKPEIKDYCNCGKTIFMDGKCLSCTYPVQPKEVKQRLHLKAQELIRQLKGQTA